MWWWIIIPRLLLATACQLVLRRKSSLPESSELEITRQFGTKRKKVINKGDAWKLRDPEPGLLGNTALVMSQDCPSHHTSICLSVICNVPSCRFLFRVSQLPGHRPAPGGGQRRPGVPGAHCGGAGWVLFRTIEIEMSFLLKVHNSAFVLKLRIYYEVTWDPILLDNYVVENPNF